MKKTIFKKLVTTAAAAIFSGLPLVQAADTLQIAYIEPLTGPFANVGDAGLKHYVFVADRINANGGVLGKKIEIIPFDNKGSPQEALRVFREAVDKGIQYITQGNGSHVAGALVDAVAKHGTRNPNKPVIYLNYAAVDPTLTNESCAYWHFRFDADGAMKLAALTDYMAQQNSIKKIFLINMDYAHGHQVSRITKEMLATKRPDIEIVGDVLHPIGKVKDFSPYIAQIKASGADSVVTGNWGNDLSLLVKASADAGLQVNYYTFYAGGLGTPTALGSAGKDRVYQVTEWHSNVAVEEKKTEEEEFANAFKQKYQLDWYYERIRTEMEMLVAAMKKAGTTEPLAVSKVLEGMQHQTPWGNVTMRPDNHQLLQPLYISILTERGDAVKYDVENTGLGFKTVGRIEAEAMKLPTTCSMKRP